MKKIINFLFKYLTNKQVNTLRKIKWFFLTPFINDKNTIENLYKSEIEIRLLEKILPIYFIQYKKKIILDIGANIGGYSFYLAPVVSKINGTCIAFEPRLQTFNRLKQNVKNSNFKAEHLALSNTNGHGTLYLPTSHGCSSLVNHPEFDGFKTESVPLMKLDNYIKANVKDDIGFIKIDVEGHEHEVIEGAVETIKTYCPLILCESENRHIMHTGRTTKIFLDYIKNLKYNIYVISKMNFKIHSVEEITVPLNKSHQGEYYYNYWFVPKKLDSQFHQWINSINLFD